MFNLEHEVAGWCRQMAAGGIKTPDVLEELESHLRDDVDQQVRAGLSQQQAFLEAVQRLGQVNLLRAELKKVDKTSAHRLKPVAFDVCGVLYLASASYALVTHEMAGAERLLGLSALGFTMLFSLGLRYGSRWVPAEGRTRTILGVASAILGVALFSCFVQLILPRFDFTCSQLVVALLWALVPLVASGAFAVGLEESKVRKASVCACR